MTSLKAIFAALLTIAITAVTTVEVQRARESASTLRDAENAIQEDIRDNYGRLKGWLARGKTLAEEQQTLKEAAERLRGAADEEERRLDQAAELARHINL